MMEKTKLIIVGGGTAGWMAAAACGKLMSQQLDITLIESKDIPTVGVGEATIPPLMGFHALLGIDEAEFLSATHGTFKLGIEFSRWGGEQRNYFHSFGNTGRGFWGGDFQHLWRRGLDLGITHDFSEYSPETQAAYAGKFTKAGQKKLNYAYHLDAGLYANFLTEFSKKHGVERIEGTVEQVQTCPSSGHISSVKLASGESIEGDFFIDCSGFRGLLIEQALHSGYEDWKHWLLCDRAVAVQTTGDAKPQPYTRSTAHQYGWQWRIPLQSRVGNGLVYSSKFLERDDAEALLKDNLEGEAINEPKYIQFMPGRRRKAWVKNCVAIGLSSGFIEPLESTSIHLIMTGVMRLLALFPTSADMECNAAEYNRQFSKELADVRDFIIAHYKVGDSGQSEFWDHCHRMDVPETLQNRLNLFEANGQILRSEDELFRTDSWTQVLIGQGVQPGRYHQGLDAMPEHELKEFLNGYHAGIQKYVSGMPSQLEFIKSYCAACR